MDLTINFITQYALNNWNFFVNMFSRIENFLSICSQQLKLFCQCVLNNWNFFVNMFSTIKIFCQYVLNNWNFFVNMFSTIETFLSIRSQQLKLVNFCQNFDTVYLHLVSWSEISQTAHFEQSFCNRYIWRGDPQNIFALCSHFCQGRAHFNRRHRRHGFKTRFHVIVNFIGTDLILFFAIHFTFSPLY